MDRRAVTAGCGTAACLVIVLLVTSNRNDHSTAVGCIQPHRPGNISSIPIYLGNGCFWERQWAYYNVETKLFGRSDAALTSIVGYGGGQKPIPGATTQSVCYHTQDERDYEALGHAEVVQVELDADRAMAQMSTLAHDFFDSFHGPFGARFRPDPMDVGSPYRSLIGLPGGASSPLYAAIRTANVHGMVLKPSSKGGDADELNTVWLMDTEEFPFWTGEVYQQYHCNFFASEGMPYPRWYWEKLWKQQQTSCRIVPTGCPEDHPLTPHPGWMCQW